MDRAVCLQVIRRLLARPDPSASGTEPVAREIVHLPPDAAEEAARFAERVADLSADERQELFDETFGRENDPDLRRVIQLLTSSTPPGGQAAVERELSALVKAANRLREHGNPYCHLLLALLHTI